MKTARQTIRTFLLRAAPAVLLASCIGPVDDLSSSGPGQQVAAPAAPDPRTLSFDDRLRQAELVFQGTVRSISYGISEPAEAGGDRVPHTFVTLGVERTFKGRVDGPTLTLRFIGGRTSTGAYMMSSAAPLFDVGERAILLVRGNGSARAPLVGWRQGRLRVVDGRVYSDTGREVQTVGTEFRLGPSRPLDEVYTHFVVGTTQVFDARLQVDLRPAITGEGDRAVAGTAAPAPLPAPAWGAAEIDLFASWLNQAVARTHTAAALAAVPAVRSVDPRARFVGPSFRAVAAPSDPLAGVAPPLAAR